MKYQYMRKIGGSIRAEHLPFNIQAQVCVQTSAAHVADSIHSQFGSLVSVLELLCPQWTVVSWDCAVLSRLWKQADKVQMITKLIKAKQSKSKHQNQLTKTQFTCLSSIRQVWYSGAKLGVQLTATISGGWEQTAREENVAEKKPD